MEALLETLKQDLAEVDDANRAAAARQQKKDILKADLPGALLDKQQESTARMTPRHNERRLLDSNNDADGWPVDPTLPLELQRVFDGDYIGDGKSWGDQYTGALLDWSEGGDVYGWGLNDYGQLGSGDAFSAAQSVSWAPLLVPVLRNKNVTMVSSGSEHSTAFSKEGFVWAWGRNDGGQLGLSDSTLSHCDTKSLQSNCDGPRPSKMLFPSSLSDLWGEHVVDMSSMWDHNLVVTRSGWTFAWGRNSYGQLGTGDTRDQNIPIKVKNSQSYRFVLARTGGSHSMALTAWGEVYVWGSGARGQLGQDIEGLGPRSTSARLSLEPIQVKALQGKIVIQIAAGWSHCIALTEEGEAWVWGGNEYGQLGLGDLKDRFAPVKIQDSTNGKGSQIGVCISIAGGHGHTLWLNSSGMVFSAGRNDGGQLGLGDTIDRSSVSYVDIPDRVWCDTPYGSEVSASYADVVCVNSKVRTDCGRRCVGISWRRDCGPSNITVGLQVSDCEPLMPGSNLGREVRVSEYSSFVISRDNNLFGWGLNTFGQVGIAPELWGRNVRKPRLIISMYGKNVTSISGGREHTVARSDREILVIESFSPQSGPVNGNSPIYIIGQGFNTFTGTLECRFAYYSNGTHTSNFPGVLWNESIYVLSVKAERFSNQRLRCFTPDVRFRNPEGEVDLEKMSQSLRTLETPRNLTIWWRGKYQLKTQRDFVWSYIALPGITGLIPQGGPVTGGTYLLVTGYGFDKMLSSDVRIKFGDEGNNWMRGCILSDKLIVTVTPPSGPSDNGYFTYTNISNYKNARHSLCIFIFQIHSIWNIDVHWHLAYSYSSFSFFVCAD
jgi:alpha-tubulin suppressor-like RCC1 family protein